MIQALLAAAPMLLRAGAMVAGRAAGGEALASGLGTASKIATGANIAGSVVGRSKSAMEQGINDGVNTGGMY